MERHLGLVKEVADQQAWRLFRIDKEDLRGVGQLGLIQAAQRYDPGSGVPFRGFAYYRIRGAMLDHARKLDRPGRRCATALRTLEGSQALLEHAHEQTAHRPADTTSMAARVARAHEIVGRAAAALAMAHAGSEGVENASAEDAPPDPEQAFLHGERRALLQEALDRLAPGDRALIEQVYFAGVSMTEYARQAGVNASTISRRHARILQRLSLAMRRPPRS